MSDEDQVSEHLFKHYSSSTVRWRTQTLRGRRDAQDDLQSLQALGYRGKQLGHPDELAICLHPIPISNILSMLDQRVTESILRSWRHNAALGH